MKSMISICVAGSVLAASACNVNAAGFFEDSKSTVRYSNFYWDENPDDGIGPTRNEWVHGIQASFKSGYYKDVLAFDYSYGAAGDLHVGDDANNITNLTKGSSVQSPHSIANTMEAYAKIKLLEKEGLLLKIGLGKTTRKRLQYADDVTRIMPAATTGFDMDYTFSDLNLYFTQIEKFSPRNSSSHATWGDDLTTGDGTVIDHLRLFGAGYVLPTGTKLDFEYAESEDYLKSTFARASHKFKLADKHAIDLSVSYGNQQDAGSLFGADHEASFVDLQTKYTFGNYYVGLAYNQVSDGDYDETFFAADHGTFASSAKNFYMFGLEGEDMVKVSAGMSFADLGIPQMRWDLKYAVSDGAEGYTDFERNEFQSVMQYRFDGALKGLHLVWLHAEHNTDGTADGVTRTGPLISNNSAVSPAGMFTHHADRLYINYVVKF